MLPISVGIGPVIKFVLTLKGSTIFEKRPTSVGTVPVSEFSWPGVWGRGRTFVSGRSGPKGTCDGRQKGTRKLVARGSAQVWGAWRELKANFWRKLLANLGIELLHHCHAPELCRNGTGQRVDAHTKIGHVREVPVFGRDGASVLLMAMVPFSPAERCRASWEIGGKRIATCFAAARSGAKTT